VIVAMEAGTINVSHELFHKVNFWEKFLGTINLVKNFYAHFLIEHLEGHHRNVATPEDPATSLKNESLFHFLPRSILGGYLSAWRIENEKLRAKNMNIFHYENKMIWFTLSYILFPVLIYMLFGYKVMIVQVISGIGGSVFLEQINYIEHYGLLRKKLEDGKYENVTIKHSWNAPQRISNYLFFKLQRHSDHHENALKPYQTLSSYEDSPWLPNSYTICIMLTTVPSAWFEVMNPLLESYEKHVKVDKEALEKSQRTLLMFLIKNNIILISLMLIRNYIIV
jgi:alkane 1-monooxygenase